MKVISREQIDAVAEGFFKQTTKEFFKLEVLQNYGFEDDCPSLQAFYKGDIKKGLELLKDEAKRVKVWVPQGAKFTPIRVRVVSYPLTPYTQWELELYKLYNIPRVGERVFLVDEKELGKIKLPEGDTLIFDDKFVMSHNYNLKAGRAVASRVYTTAKEVKPFLNLKIKLLKLAAPLKI